MMLAKLGDALRPALDATAARRIRRAFPAARSFVDLGCGRGGIGRILGADLVDIEPTDGDVIVGDIATYRPSKRYDVAIMSNVYEHIADPLPALLNVRTFADALWLSFTPWASPFGGHEFAPWHWFGVTRGCKHELYVNLFKTSRHTIALDLVCTGWQLLSLRSRYFPWKVACDALLWNIEVLAKSNGSFAGSGSAS